MQLSHIQLIRGTNAATMTTCMTQPTGVAHPQPTQVSKKI